MNVKLKTLVQALVEELNEAKGMKDAVNEKKWWKHINWKTPEYRTMFDSLGEETRQLIIDEGLCPDCADTDEGPRSEAERVMAHFGLTEEEWNALSEEEQQEYIDKLPPRGSAEKEDSGEDEGLPYEDGEQLEYTLTPVTRDMVDKERKKEEEEEESEEEESKKSKKKKKKDSVGSYDDVIARYNRVMSELGVKEK